MSWIEHENLRKRFWATVKGEGYTEDQIHDALKVDSLKQYTGSFDEALEGVRMGELKEAPFTATWKGPYLGGELMIVIRDNKDADGLTRLENQIPRTEGGDDFPGATEPAAQPDMGPTEEAPKAAPVMCIKHNAPMTRREGQYGFYHSHKHGDGWCNGYKPCSIHNLDMKGRTNGETGDFWYSHQLPDKSWCSGGADDDLFVPDKQDEIPF